MSKNRVTSIVWPEIYRMKIGTTAPAAMAYLGEQPLQLSWESAALKILMSGIRCAMVALRYIVFYAQIGKGCLLLAPSAVGPRNNSLWEQSNSVSTRYIEG